MAGTAGAAALIPPPAPTRWSVVQTTSASTIHACRVVDPSRLTVEKEAGLVVKGIIAVVVMGVTQTVCNAPSGLSNFD